MLRRLVIVSTLFAVVTALSVGCSGEKPSSTLRQSRPHTDVTGLSAMGIAFYVPRAPVGDIWLREVAGTSEGGEWVELNFTAFQVAERRVTPAFRPPADCGSPRPSSVTRAHPCSTSVTTPRGRVIHRLDQQSPNVDIYYVRLEETLVQFRIDTLRFRGDLGPIVDAFEPAGAQDIARLVGETFRERERVRRHPGRYISFTPYVPEDTPAGYTPVVVAFDNPRAIQKPYLIMRWKADDAELTIHQFALPSAFRPPESCGPDNPETHLELPCSLRFTTPNGRHVYGGHQRGPARTPIGDTMVVINNAFDDERALGQLVDSLRPRAADSMRQFACPDRKSC